MMLPGRQAKKQEGRLVCRENAVWKLERVKGIESWL
jgi:hypothetical protein